MFQVPTLPFGEPAPHGSGAWIRRFLRQSGEPDRERAIERETFCMAYVNVYTRPAIRAEKSYPRHAAILMIEPEMPSPTCSTTGGLRGYAQVRQHARHAGRADELSFLDRFVEKG
jgi:hypothetical protein